jgi:hypothetical protein
VNATPSGSCTCPAGGRAGLEARRVGVAKGPSPGSSWVVGFAGHSGGAGWHPRDPIGGTRCAKTVRRGALIASQAAQGRVGGIGPRHVAAPLVSQPLLSASTSAPADAVRPHQPGGARPWRPAESTAPVPEPPSRPEARPTDRSSPRPGARDTELVQPACVDATPGRGLSRGKGVLAV